MLRRVLKKILGQGEAPALPHLEYSTGLTFEEIQEITRNFSKTSEVARCQYGPVYVGRTKDDQLVSVILLQAATPGDDEFLNELDRISKLNHPNLVRLLGYGRRGTSRALCFEKSRNGSLEGHLSYALDGLDWHRRYMIIKGICEGSKYIHVGIGESCYHLAQLEPRHIILDEKMEPKLAAFMRLLPALGESNKYLAPELCDEYIEPEKCYIFSLGVVMIEIVMGPMGSSRSAYNLPQKLLDRAQENWRERLQETCSGSELETCCQQVKRCILIALRCVEKDLDKRPNIDEIINMLYETGNSNQDIGQVELDLQDQLMDSMQVKELLENQKREEASSSRSEGSNRKQKSSLLRVDGKYTTELEVLEHTVNRKEPPNNLSLMLLQLITKNFSEQLIIGRGGCGVVYKGILTNGVIAVKKLFNSHTIDDKMFHQEVKSMMMVNHQNIVRFLGYCSHTEEKAMESKGTVIIAQIRERLLCFEYIGNGSLDSHLTDELRGLEWHTRYKIIHGICEGLQHLHKERHIIHMDLKPANILLDDHMVPKITDFGLSRLDDKSQTMSEERLLSLGYCAPEYLNCGKRSPKSDIYSLGVIITELVSGIRRNPCTTKVHRRWKHRWNKSGKDTQLGYQQVARCLDLARRCIQMDPMDRPDIWDIVGELNKMDSGEGDKSDATENLELEDMLGIEPLELHLPFELNKQMSCSIELTNDTDDYFAFRVSTTSLRPYRINPNKDILQPRSKCSVTITLQAQEKALLHDQSRDEFRVHSTRVDGSLRVTDITGDLFREHHGRVVDDVSLVVVLDVPTLPSDG